MAVEVYENLLTNQQVSDLYELCGLRTKLIYGGKLRNSILSYFSAMLDKLKVDPLDVSVRYYNSPRPFAVHSDGLSARGGVKPVNCSVLIPLIWSPASSSTHTIFFDQLDENPNHSKTFYTHTEGKRFVPGSKKEIPTCTDYTTLINMIDEPFNQKIYDQQLSHMNYDDLYGLTVHKSIKWNVGDAIKFESNRLHCSADFGTDELLTKTHLLFKFDIPK